MSHVLSGSGQSFGAAIFLVGYFALVSSPARADLPSMLELIRQTEIACAALERDNGERPAWALALLADAQAYAGDYAAAVRTAQRIDNGFWQSATFLSCWTIHFELTGNIAELPEDAFSETNDFKRITKIQAQVDMAKALVKAGRNFSITQGWVTWPVVRRILRPSKAKQRSFSEIRRAVPVAQAGTASAFPVMDSAARSRITSARRGTLPSPRTRSCK